MLFSSLKKDQMDLNEVKNFNIVEFNKHLLNSIHGSGTVSGPRDTKMGDP